MCVCVCVCVCVCMCVVRPLPQSSVSSQKLNNELDQQIWKDKERDSETIKLLLLGICEVVWHTAIIFCLRLSCMTVYGVCDHRVPGAGESGKSTWFKQMIKIYGTGFNEKDLILYIPMVHTNTISAMKVSLFLFLLPCVAVVSFLVHVFPLLLVSLQCVVIRCAFTTREFCRSSVIKATVWVRLNPSASLPTPSCWLPRASSKK